MSHNHMIIRFNGVWQGCKYLYGEEELLLIPSGGISHSELLENVHDIVRADRNNCHYVLFSLMETTEKRKVKMRIKNNHDLMAVLANFQVPEVFVIIERKNPGANAPYLSGTQLGWQAGGIDRNEQGFMHLLASQNIYGSPMPGGMLFPTGYGMNYMHCSIPFGNQPRLSSSSQPCSTPYVNQQRPTNAPNLHRPRPRPSSAAVAHLPGHDSAPNVDQPIPSSTAFIKQSQQQPTNAMHVEQRERFSSHIVNQKEPCPDPILDQPGPSSTPCVNQVRGTSMPNIDDENKLVPNSGDYEDKIEKSDDDGDANGDGDKGVRDTVIRLPQNLRQASHPMRRKISSGAESSSHSRKKVCSEFVQTACSEAGSCKVEQSPSLRQRQQRRRSICRATGHTHNRCPRRPDDASGEKGL